MRRADLGEDRRRVGARHADRRLHRRLFGAQERIGRKLGGDRGRQGRLAGGAQRRDFAGARLEHGIVGLDGQGEARVRLGVFVTAVDLGRAGQRGELQQRFPHHRRRRLEHPTAAEREQGVADEGDLLLLEQIDDMAGGVAGRLDDLGGEPADARVIAFGERPIDAADARRLLGRSGDAELGIARAQRRQALDVVGVVMGDQRVGERPALRLGRGDDRLPVRGVDRRRRAGVGIVHQDAVIVLQAEELTHMDGHGRLVDFRREAAFAPRRRKVHIRRARRQA